MRQHEKLSPNRRNMFLKTKLWKLTFWFLNFDVSSIHKKDIAHFLWFLHISTCSDDYAHFIAMSFFSLFANNMFQLTANDKLGRFLRHSVVPFHHSV